MSENDEDFVCNLLTNTSRSGTKFPSALYMVDATKTNDISTELETSTCCDNYYYVLDHNERSNKDIKIVHLDQTLPNVPSTGEIMAYDDNTMC